MLLTSFGGGSSLSPTDPNFSNTVLLLHGDGTNGAQNNTFVDSSQNNFTITRNGNVTQGSFSPFPLNGKAYSPTVNGGSAYFDGNGDYLQIPNSAAFDLTSNFTVEGWAYFNNTSGSQCLFSKGGGSFSWSATDGFQYSLFLESGNFYWQWNIGGNNFAQIQVPPPSSSQWVHIAVTYDGTTSRLFFNGVQQGSASGSYFLPSTRDQVFVGTMAASNGNFNGYISNLRVIKGTALYTSNFTPPTAPLTAVTNTQLLLNFTNAGIYDNTGMNNLETVGNAQVSTTQKKLGTGAMYFDGGGDYLQSPVSDSLKFGTGDFTVEFWINPSALPAAVHRVFCTDTGAWTANTLVVGLGYTGAGRLFLVVGSAITGVGGATTLNTGTWYHVALTRSGSSVKLFLDGVQEIFGTSSADLNFGQAFVGGFYSGGEYFNGYIDDLRITKGVARYTANFTPPSRAFPDQ